MAFKKTICLYMVSGKEMLITYDDEEKFNQLIQSLKKSWPSVVLATPTYGIHFNLVTHYEVEE